MRAARAEDCEPSADETQCHFVDERIGQTTIYDFQNSVYFDAAGHFDWFYVQTHHNNFGDLVRDLTSAFGEPCRRGPQMLQNGFGATFDSEEVTWCFAEGDLKIVERYPDKINQSDLTFYRNRPPQPQKTYSPDSL